VLYRPGFAAEAAGQKPAGRPRSRGALPLVSRFLPTREQTKQHHNPASHHECKNTRHRDSAPTPHTAERYLQAQANQQSAVI